MMKPWFPPLIALMLLSAPLISQNQTFKNAIHAKINVVDYGLPSGNDFKMGQNFELAYLRNLAKGVNIGIPRKLGLATLPGETNHTTIMSLDFTVRLENMKEGAKAAPFLFAGAGLARESADVSDFQIPFGAGLHIRVSRHAFVKLQGEYRKSFTENRDNFQAGLGFVYMLHTGGETPAKPSASQPSNDQDLDGVTDDLDKCPTEAGPAAALGCPDQDNDGIADSEDICPDEKGAAAAGGCPDYDTDGIADKDDPCPTETGPLNGCPDSDYDGVPDKDDKCPAEAGSATYNGCPQPKDSDGDGYNDDEDQCPDQKGPLKGCPDADFDGYADKDDLCPNLAGTNKGCPDTDLDGVADNEDPCPDQPGKVNGCPDADQDGVADREDRCPDKPGSLQNNGCPDAPVVADTDKDGIPDASDPCPDKAGQFGGCPDSDGDLLADNLDKCPADPGPTGNSGCPEVKKEVKERLAYAAQAIQFETGKAVLKSESYAILDEIVQIMRDNSAYTLSISGHTDDIGGEETNLKLSQDRAKSCYDYLVFRGIRTSRLRYAGFGEARPIASNNTNEGRELNRRVDFELFLE